MTTTITTRDYTDVAKHLQELKPFRTHGALRGETWSHGTTGRLPADWRRTFEARVNVFDYVIYSYATPIAWHDREAGWVVPDEHYTVTTSRHQSAVRAALTYLGESYAE